MSASDTELKQLGRVASQLFITNFDLAMAFRRPDIDRALADPATPDPVRRSLEAELRLASLVDVLKRLNSDDDFDRLAYLRGLGHRGSDWRDIETGIVAALQQYLDRRHHQWC